MDRRRIAAELAGVGGHVDMCAELVVGDVVRAQDESEVWSNEETIIRVGGRWDLAAKKWSDDEPESVAVYRVHRGQEKAARWLAEWLRRYVTGDWSGRYRRAFTALLRGGRRSGKTHLGDVFLILFSIAKKNRSVGAFSPIDKTGFELDEALQAMTPSEWYERTKEKDRPVTFAFHNGSAIRLFSGRAYRKSGKIDLGFVNEMQEQTRELYLKVLGATMDTGGLVLGAHNPADDVEGAWADELFQAAIRSMLPGAVANDNIDAVGFDMTPKKNPLISAVALRSMRKNMTKQEAKRELDGLEVSFGNSVMFAWTAERNFIDPPPDYVDVTAEFLKKMLGVGDPVGTCMDFQGTPFMSGRVMKVFRDPRGELHPWVIGEADVEGDEAALSRALVALKLGVDPATTPAIIDASGFWQDGKHVADRTSEKTLRGCGWRYLFTPNKDSDRNPSVTERLKNGNRLLLNDLDESFLHVATACTATAEAFRKWHKVNGIPSRKSRHGHCVTAVTYFTYRLFPPVEPKRTSEIYTPEGKFSARDELAGW